MAQPFYKPLTILMLLTLISCKIDSDKAVDRERFKFSTGDDTELFFKNIRQSDYDLEENEAAGLRVFRHEDRPISDSIPFLTPTIVMNVLKDEAYILLEPSGSLSEEDPVTIILQNGIEADTIALETINRESNLEFATRIFENLQLGGTFLVKEKGSFVPFLTAPAARESFRITLSDYYRLTRIY